jgi:hypothetical protein
LQSERFAKKHIVGVDAHGVHDFQGLSVRANQDVLAVVHRYGLSNGGEQIVV